MRSVISTGIPRGKPSVVSFGHTGLLPLATQSDEAIGSADFDLWTERLFNSGRVYLLFASRQQRILALAGHRGCTWTDASNARRDRGNHAGRTNFLDVFVCIWGR